MVERDAIETLLETGSWRTARSRSPHPYDSQRRAYEPSRPNIGIPRVAKLPSRAKQPPPPCVEDEDESLAKEHLSSVVSDSSDEGPKHRGDIDQQPILLPVHEHNPERRFVIVPGAAGEDEPKTAQARYDANTCRKYVIVPSEKDGESGESGNEDKRKRDSPKENPSRFEEERPGSRKGRPEIVKRKSHQDLPRLTTDLHPEEPEPSIRRSSSRRDREKPLVHQDAQGYSSSRDRSSARPSDNDFLSPAAVKSKSARRRDRAYSDVRSDAGPRSGRSPSTRRDAEVEVSDRKRPHHSSRYSVSPGVHRRPHLLQMYQPGAASGQNHSRNNHPVTTMMMIFSPSWHRAMTLWQKSRGGTCPRREGLGIATLRLIPAARGRCLTHRRAADVSLAPQIVIGTGTQVTIAIKSDAPIVPNGSIQTGLR